MQRDNFTICYKNSFFIIINKYFKWLKGSKAQRLNGKTGIYLNLNLQPLAPLCRCALAPILSPPFPHISTAPTLSQLHTSPSLTGLQPGLLNFYGIHCSWNHFLLYLLNPIL